MKRLSLRKSLSKIRRYSSAMVTFHIRRTQSSSQKAANRSIKQLISSILGVEKELDLLVKKNLLSLFLFVLNFSEY